MQDMMVKIMQRELIPALGCTEPMAFGLCSATARRYARGKIESISIEASAAMIKGVQYVKIPRSGGLRGGKMASAIGAVGGNSDYDMEVFRDVTQEDVKRAQDLVDAGKVSLAHVQSPFKLFLKVVVQGTKGQGVAIIQVQHNNLAYIEQDGKVIKDTRGQALKQKDGEMAVTCADDVDYDVLNVKAIYDFCGSVPLTRLGIAEKAYVINKAISEDGMNNEYGLCVGRLLRDRLDQGVISKDLAMYSVMWGSAGVDARMGGSPFPAMSNTGSGNQGITCTMPVIAAGEYLCKSHEDVIRAVALSNLLTIFIKTHYDRDYARMAPVCCAAVAAGGAACGIAYLRGADVASIEKILQTVLGNVAGLFCDGAKENCATKVSMALHSAIQAMLLAESGLGADEYNGIVGRTVEETIDNFFRIQREGMDKIEDVLYSIEMGKQHVC